MSMIDDVIESFFNGQKDIMPHLGRKRYVWQDIRNIEHEDVIDAIERLKVRA